MLPDPKEYLHPAMYRWMWKVSYFLAALIFRHHSPISLCGYYYLHDWKTAVRMTDFFLGKRHCYRAYIYYLANRKHYA